MVHLHKKLITAFIITIFGIAAGVVVTPKSTNAYIPADCAKEFCDPGKGCKEISLSWDCSGGASDCEHQNCST